jgi:hypothetical protein
VADDGHGGKVPGKWKDALPVVPDKVAEHLEQGRDVPLEAMVSEKAMEQFEDHVRRQAEPVHAEDLIPVSRDDPRIQGPAPGNGSVLPKVPVRRRVIPAPFRRPSIHIDHHGKSWQVKHAESVQAGDIVPDVGRVAKAGQRTRHAQLRELFAEDYDFGLHGRDPQQQVAVGLEVVLTGIDGREHLFEPSQRVRVFTAAEEPAGASAH